mgnify:CR=1 FL=1
MEFQVINRKRNAVIPEGMFKLCGMEDAKLISMVQLNGGILLMPESVSTYQLLMLIDALNEQACEFLEAVAAECGPAEEEHRDKTPRVYGCPAGLGARKGWDHGRHQTGLRGQRGCWRDCRLSGIVQA